MTAKELIILLSELPPDCEVLVAGWNEEYRDPIPLRAIAINTRRTQVVLQEPAN